MKKIWSKCSKCHNYLFSTKPIQLSKINKRKYIDYKTGTICDHCDKEFNISSQAIIFHCIKCLKDFCLKCHDEIDPKFKFKPFKQKL